MLLAFASYHRFDSEYTKTKGRLYKEAFKEYSQQPPKAIQFACPIATNTSLASCKIASQQQSNVWCYRALAGGSLLALPLPLDGLNNAFFSALNFSGLEASEASQLLRGDIITLDLRVQNLTKIVFWIMTCLISCIKEMKYVFRMF